MVSEERGASAHSNLPQISLEPTSERSHLVASPVSLFDYMHLMALACKDAKACKDAGAGASHF